MAKLLVESGADVNQQNEYSEYGSFYYKEDYDDYGEDEDFPEYFTALSRAITTGDFDMVKYLVEKGAKITEVEKQATDKELCTAIYDYINK